MAFGIDDALLILAGIPGIANMFKKRPKAPAIPEYQGMTPEEEQAYTKSLDLGIGEATAGATKRVRESAAARGTYRSGQLPALEAEIEAGGVKARTQGLSDLALRKAELRATGQMNRYNLLENRYIQQLNEYGGEQQAGGESVGNILATLSLLHSNRYKLRTQPNWQGRYPTRPYGF